MQKFIKHLLVFSFIFCLAFSFVSLQPVSAQSNVINDPTGIGVVGNGIILHDKDPRLIATSIINSIIGFLGIIALIIMLIGGFKWMTAGGNSDKVDEAKKVLATGIIGLIIVLSAFAIASFIIKVVYLAV